MLQEVFTQESLSVLKNSDRWVPTDETTPEGYGSLTVRNVFRNDWRTVSVVRWECPWEQRGG